MRKDDFENYCKKVAEDEGLMELIRSYNYIIANNSTNLGLDQYYLCCLATDLRQYCKKNWSKTDYINYVEDKLAPFDQNADFQLHRLFYIFVHTRKLDLSYIKTYMTFITIPKKDRTSRKMWDYSRKFYNDFQVLINN